MEGHQKFEGCGAVVGSYTLSKSDIHPIRVFFEKVQNAAGGITETRNKKILRTGISRWLRGYSRGAVVIVTNPPLPPFADLSVCNIVCNGGQMHTPSKHSRGGEGTHLHLISKDDGLWLTGK